MADYYTNSTVNYTDGSFFKDDTNGLPQNYFSPLASSAMADFWLKGEYEWAVAKPCKPGTVTEIDTALRNFFTVLKGIQEYGDLYVNGVLGEAQDLTYEISKTVSIISGVLRTFTQRLRNFVMDLIKELIQGAIQCLLTPLLDQIKDSVLGVILDQLMCKFDEIMDSLKDLVSDFLFALVNLGINNPALCATEAYTNALLNNLANTIDDTIAPVLDEISDLLGGAAQVVGSVFSAIDFVLGFEGLLCSEPKCPEDVDKFKTGPFGGPSKAEEENFSKFSESASSGLSNFNQSAEEWLNETFPADTNDAGSPCYTGSYECGSPQIVFFGGGGSGASASSVVNGIGQIIGVNLLTGGSDYTSAPFVSIVDPAGCGTNAEAYAVMNETGDQVESVVLTNSGFGYATNDLGGVPIINYFYGTPNPVQVGNTITLTWDVSNFTTLSLGISGYNDLTNATGSVSFIVNESDVQFAAGSDTTTITYKLTATKQNEGSSPQTVTKDYVVTVSKIPVAGEDAPAISSTANPKIVSYTGSPSVGTQLSPGSILTLSWETENSDNISLSYGSEIKSDLPVSGSLSIPIPTDSVAGSTITYLLKAVNTTNSKSISQAITYTITPSTSGSTSSVSTSVTESGVGITETGAGAETGAGSQNANNAVSELNNITVLQGGIDYDSQNDTVEIVGGNNGATFELVTTQIGQIVDIKILTPGYGFTTIPEIQINSKKGVGAKFRSQLKFTSLDQFLAQQKLDSVDPTKLVQVIDCVYK